MTIYALCQTPAAQSAPGTAQTDANGKTLTKGSNLPAGSQMADLSAGGALQTINAPTSQVFEVVAVGSGTITATAQLLTSCDGVNWLNFGSPVTTTSGSGSSIAGMQGTGAWPFWSAYVTATTGTVSMVKVLMNA